MAGYDFISQVQENAKQLTSLEQMLGKGLNIPYNATNSGSRKIMNGTHQSHTLVLNRAEIPFIATGKSRMGSCNLENIANPISIVLIVN